jgi:starch synthase
MTPVYLKHKYQVHGVFQKARSVLAIHNLAHQGTSLAHTFSSLHLPSHVYSDLEWIYTEPDGRQTPV